MPNRTEDIIQYIFQATDALLLDANVWYLIYGPSKPGDQRVAIYSRALTNMQAAHSRIYIDVLIVSEFINAYARFQHSMAYPHPATRPSFKQFRQSAAFKPIAQDIAAAVRRVLQHCDRVESGFGTLDIQALVAEYELGESDFNDQVLAALCRSQGLMLVTDDGDFAGHGLNIATANKRLLAACRSGVA